MLLVTFQIFDYQGPVSFRDGDRVGVTQVEQLQGKELDKNQVSISKILLSIIGVPSEIFS